MKKLQVALMGPHLLSCYLGPGPLHRPHSHLWGGWSVQNTHTLLALQTRMALDVTMFLGMLCLVTGDCFKFVGPKRSHFNRKN